jgi:GNAT superfamily N-acetyltransferase
MVEFLIEPLESAYAEATELLQKHWGEVAPYRDLCRLNPDLPTYQAMAHKLCLITARIDGRLVGYIMFVIAPHLHYRDVLMATDDLHFLDPACRKTGIGLKMFAFAEKVMRGKGVQIMTLRTKADPRLNHGAIFEHLGYDQQDIVYTKRLDR